MVGGSNIGDSVCGARSPPAVRSGPREAATAPFRPRATTTVLGSRRPSSAYYCCICRTMTKKTTCRGLSRYLRHASFQTPLGQSSLGDSWNGPGAFLSRSRSSLGWGGDKAHYSSATVIRRVLSRRRSGAASGLREQLEGPDARIQPQPRSESSPLPAVQTKTLHMAVSNIQSAS